MVNLEEQIEKVISKLSKNMELFQDEHVPNFTVDGKYTNRLEYFYELNHWTFSFFTGAIFYAHEYTKNPSYLKYLYQFMPMYEKKIFEHAMDTMHDLGFLYSLYAVAMYKTTGDEKAKKMGIKAADELLKRFKLNGSYIQAWERMDTNEGEKIGVMIVDCMMNLPLLFWAWKETGHSCYYDVGMAHANTTMKYMVRKDGSISHAFQFAQDGTPLGERNFCGYGIGSAWARGTAWGIYGFAIAYQYTHNSEFLETAKKLAKFFISNLPEDCVPIWDFRLPPHEKKTKEITSAVIAACGLMEISLYTSETIFSETAQKIIEKFSNPICTCFNDEVQAILSYQAEGCQREGALWGDYFYLEALMRLNSCKTIYW